jgi:uncharacterized membrane protein (DUF4010 family)
MDNFDILLRLVVALAFGAILGLETEKRAESNATENAKHPRAHARRYIQQRLGGVRTYTILALFGAIGGTLFAQGYQLFAYMIFSAVLLIVVAAYVLNVRMQGAFGMTTEIAILITVLLGFMVAANLLSIEILTVITVVMAFILSQKRGIASLIANLEHRELQDIIKFAIVVALFLPFMPDHEILVKELPLVGNWLNQIGGGWATSLGGLSLLNPLRTWQYIILISGFNLASYFVIKFWRLQGLAVAGLLGGFISSTTTTIAMAQKSLAKSKTAAKAYAATALVANGSSFLQILVLAYSASYIFGNAIFWTAMAMGITSIAYGLLKLSSVQTRIHHQEVQINYDPYSIVPAVQFTILLTAIKFISQVAQLAVGQSGLAVSLALSGVTGTDLSTITLSELVAKSLVGIDFAVWLFIAANTVNYIAKSAYSFVQGDKVFMRTLVSGLALSAIVGIIVHILLDVIW